MQSKQTITVTLVDDHPIVRAGIKAILTQSPSFDVIAEADNGKEGLTQIEALDPDYVLLDIQMPEMDGLSVAREMQRKNTTTRAILLSQFIDHDTFIQIKKLPVVRGALLKNAVTQEIVKCFEAAERGIFYISKGFLKSEPFPDDPKNLENIDFSPLTASEVRILKLISQDKTSSEIAEFLCKSKRTIDNHRLRIGQKLNLSGNNSLLAFALKNKNQIRTL